MGAGLTSAWLKLLRKAPVGAPGKARLARLLLGSLLEERDVPLRDRWDNQYIVPSLRETMAFHLLIDGVYEPQTFQLLRDRLARGSVFVDVGANIGLFSIPMAKQVGPDGIVVAVEPSPTLFLRLQRHAEMNGVGRIRLKNVAAHDRSAASVSFYEAPADRFGMGSCAARFHDKPVSVRAETLDDIAAEEGLRRVDLLKVDVEGCEQAVFLGAKRLLESQPPPLIVFEFNDWAEERAPGTSRGAAQRTLREFGYRIWRLRDFLKGKESPCREIVTSGSDMLVAMK